MKPYVYPAFHSILLALYANTNCGRWGSNPVFKDCRNDIFVIQKNFT